VARVLLLDFEAGDRDFLRSEKYDVELLKTSATADAAAFSRAVEAGEAFFVLAAGEGGKEGVSAAGSVLAKRLEKGGLAVFFIKQSGAAAVKDYLGGADWLEPQELGRPESIRFNPKALFYVPFERFRASLRHAFKLVPRVVEEGAWEVNVGPAGSLEVFAKSADGYPVALLGKMGKGSFLILPSFGPKDVQVAQYLLRNKMLLEGAAKEGEMPAWFEDEEYAFPEIKALYKQKEDEVKRHEQALADLDRLIQESRKASQDIFYKLLLGQGPELKKAVLNTFRYLGWPVAIDVDEYWKNVIRDKEEDIWLIEPGTDSLEASLRRNSLILVVVRSDKNWASDEDCVLLQRYKGRRMQEFGNTNMKAVLVGNYFLETEPKLRQNPFSKLQTDEAAKDGNGLLSTWELFRAVKAEKEGAITKEAVREAVRKMTGLVTFGI